MTSLELELEVGMLLPERETLKHHHKSGGVSVSQCATAISCGGSATAVNVSLVDVSICIVLGAN